ncbi:MAG: PAS domain-containing sensor histidine kinase [Cyclobacteriaceae bacterium]|nr:PAS domain-containing sensor histidine kinase [Cyclobacteriaceae bacterium]
MASELSLDLMEHPIRKGGLIAEFRSCDGKNSIREGITFVESQKQNRKAYCLVRNQQGTTIYLHTAFAPVAIRRGVTYVLLLISDLTEQRVFENKLVSQSAFIADLIQKANAVIFSVDTRGYVTDWNQHAIRVTGYERNDVYARKASDLLEDQHAKEIFNGFIASSIQLEQLPHLELPLLSREGKRIVLFLSGAPQLSTSGVPVGVTFVGQDITELIEYRTSLEAMVEDRTRELQRALTQEQEAVEVKSRFVSIASHEFRTPLSSILHASRLLKEGKRITRTALLQKLDAIERQVNHMKVLLDDVLTYGKADQPKIRLMTTSLDPVEFFKEVSAEVTESVGGTHRVVQHLNNLPPTITTDAKMMRGVVTNLLINAMKFSPNQETVFLDAVAANGRLTLTVRDKGLGIPPEDQERIFEPFTRGTNSAAIAGTGLGLSIVKKTVEVLGGSIVVNSVPGEGSEFVVRIPLT